VSAVSERARAIVRFVERRGGRVGYDALWTEFVCRRDWYPEDFDSALSAALETGAFNFDGTRLRLP